VVPRTIRRAVVAAFAAAAIVTGALAAAASPAGSTALCGSLGSPPAVYAHVIWIWMENHSYDKVVGASGSKQASKSSFVDGTLIPSCGLATNYHAISHPSLPNYVAATSGGTQGISNDCAPAKCALNAASLFEQTSSWRSYHESMPSDCALSDSGAYPADHNAAAYFTRIRSKCTAWDVPLGSTSSGSLASDLKNGTLPQFALVVPNTCDSTESCPVSTGDAWLQAWIPKIALSKTYQSGKTAVFVTWDEGGGGSSGENCLANLGDTSCHVATIVISPYTRPGTTSGTLFTHYSLLKTTEQLLGLGALGLAGANGTQSMRSAFHL